MKTLVMSILELGIPLIQPQRAERNAKSLHSQARGGAAYLPTLFRTQKFKIPPTAAHTPKRGRQAQQ